MHGVLNGVYLQHMHRMFLREGFQEEYLSGRPGPEEKTQR